MQDNDTLSYLELEEIKVYPQRTVVTNDDKRKFDRLIFRVKKIYPLVKIVERKLAYYDTLLVGKSQKEKRRLMKQAEDDILKEYGDIARNLTFSEGKILLKLIDRQINRSSYEILKDHIGSFRTVFWQGVARLFGANLKTEYHPENNVEDRNIEEIILLIDSGRI